MRCEKSANIISYLRLLFEKQETFLITYLSPILLLALRIMIAYIFLKSGLNKMSNFDNTVDLFENNYLVPLIPPIIAAFLATTFELICSLLLIIGLATRLAVIPLIVMTAITQFTIIENLEHFYWFAILATILIYGAGSCSFDRLIKQCANKCRKI